MRRKRNDPPPAPYAWCEPSPTQLNTWHLRPLPPGEGLKLGGGVTTDSFCGRVKSPNGWDLGREPTEADARSMYGKFDHTGRLVCSACVDAANAPVEAP